MLLKFKITILIKLKLGQNISINLEMELHHLLTLKLYLVYNQTLYVLIHLFNLNFRVENIIHCLLFLKKVVINMEIYIIIQKLLIQIFN